MQISKASQSNKSAKGKIMNTRFFLAVLCFLIAGNKSMAINVSLPKCFYFMKNYY